MAGWRRSRGFSLLEIIVAIAILGSAFTALLAAHATALRREAAARRLMTGTLLARKLLTEVEVSGTPELGSDAQEADEAFPGYSWERHVEPAPLPFGEIISKSLGTSAPVSIPSDALRQVRIVVTWAEGGRTESTELIFYAVAGVP